MRRNIFCIFLLALVACDVAFAGDLQRTMYSPSNPNLHGFAQQPIQRSSSPLNFSDRSGEEKAEKEGKDIADRIPQPNPSVLSSRSSHSRFSLQNNKWIIPTCFTLVVGGLMILNLGTSRSSSPGVTSPPLPPSSPLAAAAPSAVPAMAAPRGFFNIRGTDLFAPIPAQGMQASHAFPFSQRLFSFLGRGVWNVGRLIIGGAVVASAGLVIGGLPQSSEQPQLKKIAKKVLRKIVGKSPLRKHVDEVTQAFANDNEILKNHLLVVDKHRQATCKDFCGTVKQLTSLSKTLRMVKESTKAALQYEQGVAKSIKKLHKKEKAVGVEIASLASKDDLEGFLKALTKNTTKLSVKNKGAV